MIKCFTYLRIYSVYSVYSGYICLVMHRLKFAYLDIENFLRCKSLSVQLPISYLQLRFNLSYYIYLLYEKNRISTWLFIQLC